MTTTKQLQKRIEALEAELATHQAYAEMLKPTSDPYVLQAANDYARALGTGQCIDHAKAALQQKVREVIK